MLEALDLECVRGERRLFHHMNFTLAAGTLMHVAGANGSGKTSLLRMLCGLLAPEHGEIRWRGENIRNLREEYWKELVYIGHLNALKDELSALDNLIIAAGLNGVSVAPDAAGDALAQFGLAGFEHAPVKTLSQGQKRRVTLARLALSRDVPLWILDEPFTALDSAAVERLEGLLMQHIARGGSVIFTTHQEVALTARVTLRVDLNAELDSVSPVSC